MAEPGRRDSACEITTLAAEAKDPELRRELLARAEAEGTTTSELIREALRRYLTAA